MNLNEGDVFAGRFRLGLRLGGGGFGEVHEAEELKGGGRVALKVLHHEMVSHPTLRERFEQESRITTMFKSPHVVAVVDAGVDAALGRPWVAFELLAGETLAQRIEREPVTARATVAALFEQLGEAVGAAHQAGVIHADLKPENLFLTGPTAHPTLKVLDFGIARLLKAGRTSTKVTTEMGSPAWTAPEQFRRGEKLRASTDVWALGMLAFRLLTGRHFLLNAEDGSPLACIVEICATDLPTASARAGELGVGALLPPEFDRWFRHCVVRAPEERFQHGRAAVVALLALLRPRAGVAATVALAQPPVSPWREPGGTAAVPSARVLDGVLQMLDQSDYGEARRALESASTRPDAAADVWALRGECDMALGRYDDAVEDWSQAIARAPSVGAYLFGRSAAFEALGRAGAARADAAVAAMLSGRR